MKPALLLLLITAATALAGPFIEGRDRSAELSARGYTAAIQIEDVEAALSWLASDRREHWRIFVQHQSGDRIQLISTAVRRTPLLVNPRGWAEPVSITIVADIDGKGQEHWRATSLVHGQREGDRFMMDSPPFGPDEPWLTPPES